MPIVTDLEHNLPKTNGEMSNSILNSLEDEEESFVVLERSTANDQAHLDVSIQSLHSFQPFSNNCSFPVFNNLSSSGSASNSTLQCSQHQGDPVQPLRQQFDSNNISVSAEEIQKQLQEVLRENVNLKENLFQTNLAMKQHMNTVRLLQDRASDVQKHHQAKFEETKSLILKLGSEKNELQESNNLMSGELVKAKQDIKELKEANLAFGNEMTKVLSENNILKKQLICLQETLQTVTENNKKDSLQPTTKEMELRELVDQLTRKLEVVERSRRQQEFDIDRLTAQLGRTSHELTETQRQLALSENALQAEKEKPLVEVKSGSSSLNCGEIFLKYDGILKQLKTTVQEEKTRFNSLSSWLSVDPDQFEVSELRRLLAEEQSQSICRKESLCLAVSTIHELLSDFQKLGEELELLKADRAIKESHSFAYDELQKKGFTERLDALTAKLVEKEEALGNSEKHLASLQEALRIQNTEKKDEFSYIGFYDNEETKNLKEQVQILSSEIAAKDEKLQTNHQEMNLLKTEVQKLQTTAETVAVLEEQAKIYQDDFKAERVARETLVAEKERLLEDLKHLQLRNQELIDEVSRVQNGQLNEYLPSAPGANAHTTRREQLPSIAQPSLKLDIGLGQMPIFHEKQEGNLCAQHCLNTLLQGAHFNAVDLAELAQEMDFAEKTKLAEAGTDSKDYKKFLEIPSENMDDTGYFSVQVIGCALKLWGLEMVPYTSSEARAMAVRSDPDSGNAFICNCHSHWFTVRKLGPGLQWYNLNSTLDIPEPIPNGHLHVYLEHLQCKGHSVFIVFGDLPECPADKINTIGIPSDSQISRKRKASYEEDTQPLIKLHFSLKKQSNPIHNPGEFINWLLFSYGQFTNSLFFRIRCFRLQNNIITFKPEDNIFKGTCPNTTCGRVFNNYEALHAHVIECLGIQD